VLRPSLDDMDKGRGTNCYMISDIKERGKRRREALLAALMGWGEKKGRPKTNNSARQRGDRFAKAGKKTAF